MRPDVALAAEAAAGVRGDDAHVRRVDAERRADDRDDGRTRLHGVPEGDAVAVPLRDGAGGLHRVVVPRGLHVGLLDAHGGLRAGGVDVALVEDDGVRRPSRARARPRRAAPAARPRSRRATAARAASAASIDSPSTIATGQPSQGIRSSVNGSVSTAAGGVEPGEVGQVGRGEHGRDPGQGAGRGGVDPAQRAGRDRRADEHGVQHPFGRWSAANRAAPVSFVGRLDAGAAVIGHLPAMSRARTAALRAMVTLNPLRGRGWRRPCARSTAGSSASRVSGTPTRSGSRHGLPATDPERHPRAVAAHDGGRRDDRVLVRGALADLDVGLPVGLLDRDAVADDQLVGLEPVSPAGPPPAG